MSILDRDHPGNYITKYTLGQSEYALRRGALGDAGIRYLAEYVLLLASRWNPKLDVIDHGVFAEMLRNDDPESRPILHLAMAAEALR
jgi:hypothetical protein